MSAIESWSDLQNWIQSVEQSSREDIEYQALKYIEQIDVYERHCTSVLDTLEHTQSKISEIDANTKFVRENSSTLQDVFQRIQGDKEHLEALTSAIDSRIAHFKVLDTAVQVLNVPGEDVVLSQDFFDLLKQLDVSLDYVQSHLDFVDGDIYAIRLQQCMTRCMMLIKMYFNTNVRQLTDDIVWRLSSRSTTISLVDNANNFLKALLYKKFSSKAIILKPLLCELESRAQKDPLELGSLLEECHSIWFSNRVPLITNLYTNDIKTFGNATSNVSEFAKLAWSQLFFISSHEWDSYRSFFDTGLPQLESFMHQLSNIFLHHLKSKLPYEESLPVLSELCQFFMASISLDSHARDLPPLIDDDEESQDSAAIRALLDKSKIPNLAFSTLIEPLLSETEARLLKRANAILKSEIKSFPTKLTDDLVEYVNGQLLERYLAHPEIEKNYSSSGTHFDLPSEAQQHTWYPTVYKTVHLLLSLNGSIPHDQLLPFANDAVVAAVKSVVYISNSSMSDPRVSYLDPYLFVINQILVLKQTLALLDLAHYDRSTSSAYNSIDDLAKLAKELWADTSLILNPNALTNKILPAASSAIHMFSESLSEAQSDIHIELDKACTEFFNQIKSPKANASPKSEIQERVHVFVPDLATRRALFSPVWDYFN